MPSINLDVNYFDHMKAMRLEARLGNGADGLPVRLWTYVGRQKPETGILEMLPEEIERVCRWWGGKGELVKAMVEIGFIEREGEIYIVHDWLEHSGHLATFKKRAIKAARKRWGAKRKRSNASSIAKDESKQSPSSAVHSSAVHSNTGLKEKYLDFVWLTPAEHDKLKASLGRLMGPYLERLNGYIGQIGEKKAAAKYTSHYHTILNWHRKDAEEGKTNAPNGSTSDPSDTPLARRAREIAGLRKAGMRDFGQISPGLRDLPAPVKAAEQPDGNGGQPNGRPLAGLRQERT